MLARDWRARCDFAAKMAILQLLGHDPQSVLEGY
jgi:hypothetical protein